MKCRTRVALSWVTVLATLSIGVGQAWAEEVDDAEEEIDEAQAVAEGDGEEEVGAAEKDRAEATEEGEKEVFQMDAVRVSEPSRDVSWRWLIGGQAFELLAGTVWYVLDEETNEVDWDYSGIYTSDDVVEEGNLAPRELKPQSERWRGLDGFRFEDNVMVLNTPLHPMAGAGYYILARNSGLGAGASALTANISSLIWEGAIEHQEVFSINDQILTPIGGIPLGEAYVQLGHFFRSAEPTGFNRTMSWVFGLPYELRDRIHGDSPARSGVVGDHGWPEEIWHRFTIQPSFSVASTREEGAEDFGDPRFDGELLLGMELSRLSDYRRAGEHSDWVSGPVYSSLSANLALGQDVYDWGLKSDLDFAGYYRHDVDKEAGKRRGTSLFVGTGMGFRHIQHRYDDFRDRYGIVHFPGLRLDASWFGDVADVRLRYGLTPDFSALETRAYPDFWAAEQEGYQGFQTVVEKEGYYYGAGVSSVVDLEVGLDPVHLHWGWDLHWARSIDYADRFKDAEEFEGYLSMTDLISIHQVGAMFALPADHLRAGLQGEYRHRAGTLEEPGEEGDSVESRTREMRGMGVIQLVY